MNPIFVNLRCMQRRLTGVQRYTQETTSRLKLPWKGLSPRHTLGHVAGPLWDQVILPVKAKSGLLWSPANTGPIMHPQHIVTIHDLAVLKKEPWFSQAFQQYYSFVIPKLVQNAKYIITDSNFIRSEILSKFDVEENRVEVCPCGVDGKFFVESTPNTDKPYLLTVSSMDPRKNLPRLFHAWEKVHHRFPDLELRVVGGNSSIFKGIDFSRVKGSNIQFLGNISDAALLDQYRAATAFLYPSLYEGFGLPVIEAMAAGLPVLTSENSSMSEVTGKCAILVDPFSEESIIAGIIHLVESTNLRLSLSISGKEIAHEFSWDRTARAVSSVLIKHTR